MAGLRNNESLWPAAVTMMMVNIACAIPGFMIGAMYVFYVTDISMPAEGLGLTISLYWIAATLVSRIAGQLVDRFGIYASLKFAVALSSGSLLLNSLTGSSWAGFLCCVAVGGFSTSISHPAANLMITRTFPDRLQGLMYGLKQAAVPLSSSVVGLLIPFVAVSLGWRISYIIIGCLSAVVLICLPNGRHQSWFYGGGGSPGIRKTGADAMVPKSFYWVISVVTFFGTGAANIVAFYSVPSGIETGLSPEYMGYLYATASFLGAAVRIVAGMFQKRAYTAIVTLVALLLAGVAGSLLMSAGTQLTYSFGLVLALGFGWGWSGLTHYIVSVTAGDRVAQATSITQTGTYAGCALLPLLISFVPELHTPVNLWMFSGFCYLIGALLMTGVFLKYRQR